MFLYVYDTCTFAIGEDCVSHFLALSCLRNNNLPQAQPLSLLLTYFCYFEKVYALIKNVFKSIFTSFCFTLCFETSNALSSSVAL